MISYDTNVLMYALEGHSQFQVVAQTIVRRGEREGAILSVLVKQELLTGATLRGPKVFAQVEQALGLLATATYISVDASIVEAAANLTLRYGRKLIGYDAIHLATAMKAGVGEFWTNDKSLTRLKLDGLKIRSLGEAN